MFSSPSTVTRTPLTRNSILAHLRAILCACLPVESMNVVTNETEPISMVSTTISGSVNSNDLRWPGDMWTGTFQIQHRHRHECLFYAARTQATAYSTLLYSTRSAVPELRPLGIMIQYS